VCRVFAGRVSLDYRHRMGLYRVLAVSQTDILVRSAGTPRKPTNAEKDKFNALRLIRLLHVMRLVGLSTVRFEGVSIMFDVGCYRGAGSEGGGYGGVEEGFDIRASREAYQLEWVLRGSLTACLGWNVQSCWHTNRD
jgi:hypothetical protein